MYKIYYPPIPNMGDLLNKYMLEDMFNITVDTGPVYECNLSAIGSGLGAIQKGLKMKTRLKQAFYKSRTIQRHYIWGTGFLNDNHNTNQFIYPEVIIASLRGELTRKRIEGILNQTIDVPLGDGGLLADRWVGPVQKKHQIGIIPHFKEQMHPLISDLKTNYHDAIIVDLKQDPKEVVRTIASCEYIISSSLHGLIIADSYGIPNLHILLYPYGEKMSGDGFKFSDYYSAFSLEDFPYDINSNPFPSIAYISENYKISRAAVETIKDKIYDAFPQL